MPTVTHPDKGTYEVSDEAAAALLAQGDTGPHGDGPWSLVDEDDTTTAAKASRSRKTTTTAAKAAEEG